MCIDSTNKSTGKSITVGDPAPTRRELERALMLKRSEKDGIEAQIKLLEMQLAEMPQ